MEPIVDLRITDLPGEILNSIFDFIIRPSDLKALCLTCKATSEPAFRHLYRSIPLPFTQSDPEWTRIECLTQSQHLHHIQSIDIGHSQALRGFLFCKNLQPLLEKLRPNSLKSFSYGLHGRPQAHDLITIWRQHKSLRKLKLDFNLYAPSLREILRQWKGELCLLTSVEELVVDFGQEQDEASALALFDLLQTQKLRSIHLRHLNIGDFVPDTQPYTFSSLGTNLVSRHFPTTLTSIALAFVRLPSSKDWKLSEYRALLALELYDCSDVEQVLDSVEKPTLKHFHIERRTKTIDISLYLSVRRFLKRFGSLESLGISMRVAIESGGEKLAPAIREHGLHLKSLWVDGYSEEPGPPVLCDNLNAYPRLEYLALPLRTDVMMVERCKRILRQLPHLEVLVVYQSSVSAAEFDLWENDGPRLNHVEACASMIFSRMPVGGKLRLLVFAKVVDEIPLQAGMQNEKMVLLMHAWRYCFIQAKDELSYGRRSSACSVPDQKALRKDSHTAVLVDIEAARYMFPGAGARILG